MCDRAVRGERKGRGREEGGHHRRVGRGERHFGGRGGAFETPGSLARQGIEGANYVAGNTFSVTSEPF